MKTENKNLFILPVLIASFGLILTGRLMAQTFTTLHNFTGSDGAGPSTLILSGNILFGTTVHGGSSGNGSVFAMNIDGTGLTNVYSFTALSAPYYQYGTNGDGASPVDKLLLLDKTLYGTASLWRQFGPWNGVRCQHQWHGFYKHAQFQ